MPMFDVGSERRTTTTSSVDLMFDVAFGGRTAEALGAFVGRTQGRDGRTVGGVDGTRVSLCECKHAGQRAVYRHVMCKKERNRGRM